MCAPALLFLCASVLLVVCASLLCYLFVLGTRLLFDVLAMCFSGGQVVNRNGVDIMVVEIL